MDGRSQKSKILIVDDEEKIRDILSAVLEEDGYEIETAKEGNEAIEKSEAFNPHLLIVDLRMPGMDGIETIIGESAVMQQVRQQIRQIAETDATVLIEGQSGTGKELAAKAIHYESKRKKNPLIIMDCTAVPANLIESEFFGHEKGAFTDARQQRIGKFEEADTGTIFLDEISELPAEA